MPFKSAKRRSGQRLSGSTGQSNTGRVSRAGRGRRVISRLRGSEHIEVPFEPVPALGTPIISAITATTATATTTNTTSEGTLYFVVSENASPPSVAQIKVGDDAGDVAGVDSGNGAVAASPIVTAITGLTTATDYTYHAYQENAGGGSAVVSSAEFTTL